MPADIRVITINTSLFQTTLEAISESIVASLEHKTPSVVVETITFLARCFAKCTPATLPKKLLKMFVVPLLKVIPHTINSLITFILYIIVTVLLYLFCFVSY